MNLDSFLAAYVTQILLAVNILLSLAGFNNPRVIEATILDVHRIRTGREYWRLVSSGFVHGDGMHLFMNMLSLFFIGPFVELAVGPGYFLLIYFAALVVGSLWSVLENFRKPAYRALGASGAVSGVTTVFALFAPFAMIIVFVVPMPAILFAVLYIGWSAFASGRVQDGIGHAAHLGGALTGVVLVCLIWPAAIENLWSQLTDLIS
ncbi:MAG: rhomboid family intramembrane serine protease [Alphaproteobacteria bacterium]|nr:rhomboid family intramembrane serine protease [Alphaproteobacteria bacterium]